MERREFLRGAVAAGAGGLAAALLPCRAGAEGKDGHVLAAGPAALSLPADRLVIAYRDGTRVDAGDGRLVWRSAEGEILDDRPLHPGDIALLEETLARGGETLLRLTAQPARAEISDWRGWREVMDNATYRLTDPRGRVVRHRPLAVRDLARLRTLMR